MMLQAWHTCIWGVSHILLCRSSQSLSVRLDGERRCTAIFRSLQRRSIGFKSGLWLGYSRTFKVLSRCHSCFVSAVCLGLLTCWKVNLQPRTEVLSDLEQVFIGISLYIAPFICPSILTSLPVPAADKHPHSMMLLPPCFTVGMLPGFLQT